MHFQARYLHPSEVRRIVREHEEDRVLTTEESCQYLRITKPTFFKYIRNGRIKATKAGKGWRVLKSELIRFLNGESRA
jgi:excisionase family DNA binding protein